jgi:predicted DNA-binding protein (MmcQ/YjbR family)
MSDELVRALRAYGLGFPGAHSKSPWPGHDDLAVNDKTFAYLPADGQPFTLSVKLRYTGEAALELSYAKPTAYGLGKSGWVSFAPAEGEIPPLDQLKEWIEESYRARRRIDWSRSWIRAMNDRRIDRRRASAVLRA